MKILILNGYHIGLITSNVWECITQLYYQCANALRMRSERIENAFETHHTCAEPVIRHALVMHRFFPWSPRHGFEALVIVNKYRKSSFLIHSTAR